MADYGIGRQGGSLRDALNQAYPLTNLGGISTGFPPMPPRVGMTAQPVPSQGGPPVISPVPPVPGPTSGLGPSVPGVPPNPETVQAQLLAAQRQQQQPGMMMGQGPPNYAAQLGLTQAY